MLLQAVDKSLHDMSQNSKNLIHETYKVSFPKEMVEAAIRGFSTSEIGTVQRTV
jgi:hypothetical protein